MKECDHMTKCCNICHTPIEDENSIIMDNSMLSIIDIVIILQWTTIAKLKQYVPLRI